MLLKFVKKDTQRIYFKVYNNYLPYGIEADTGDIIYFENDFYKTLKYKKL